MRTITYFQWNVQFYEWTDGVAMVSHLNPVVANFYVEKFEQILLRSAQMKQVSLSRWYVRYLAAWKNELSEFLVRLNSIHCFHRRIQLTRLKRKEGRRPTAALLRCTGNDRLKKSWATKYVTDRCLRSNNHPKQERAVKNNLWAAVSQTRVTTHWRHFTFGSWN